jgi:SAM-dependent methyltransferase
VSGGRSHWDAAYEGREPGELSWFQAEPEASVELIEGAVPDHGAGIIDMGGGASRLAARLAERGYSDLTVADISAAALERGSVESGGVAERISWQAADARDHDFGREFDLWHDRAVFHFMVDDEEREGYLRTLRRALAPGGHIVLAGFGTRGPERCSGLPVRRYGSEDLVALLPDFELLQAREQTHSTPSGTPQEFLYALLRRREPGEG